MTEHNANIARVGTAFAALALVFALLVSLCTTGLIAYAEQGPADGQHTAEITFVSKDKKSLKFLYLSGLVMETGLPGMTYDKGSNTLTLENTNLSNGDTHYSLTITNMGEDFQLNIVGNVTLDYLSLESVGYATGCTITGYGTLTVGYLDIQSDGKAMNTTIDNTVTVVADTQKMGYNNLSAIRITTKNMLQSMEPTIVFNGDVDADLQYTEDVNGTSYTYESNVTKFRATPRSNVIKGSDGKWGYYVSGQLDRSFNGVAGNAYGMWKIDNGLVNFDYTGLAKGPFGWYMFVNGKADEQFNGLAKNENGIWFVEDGLVNFGYIGPLKLNGQTYQIEKGKVV